MKEKIRICHVASGDLWAGAEVQVFNILSGLKKLGRFDLYAIIMNRGRLYKELSRLGVVVCLVDEKKVSIIRQIIMIRSFIRKNRIDIVHSHRYKENILSSLIGLTLSHKYKLLKTQHGSFDIVTTWRLKVYRAVELVLTKILFDKVITVSKDIGKELATFLPSIKIVTIYNSINPDNYTVLYRDDHFGSNNNFSIGIVGRLVKIKNVDDFLNIAVALHGMGIHLKAYVVGDGPENNHLKNRVRNLEAEKYIIFLGNRDNISDFYNMIDILFITSFHEGVPTVLLEAMHFGKIVVAHKVGGIPEIIVHDQNAFLYDDVDQAIEVTFGIIQEQIKYKHIKHNAKDGIKKKYTHLIQAEKYADEYIALAG